MIAFIDVDRCDEGSLRRSSSSAAPCGQPRWDFYSSRRYRAAKSRPASARTLSDQLIGGEITRLHTELDYRTPIEAEHDYYAETESLLKATASQENTQGRNPTRFKLLGDLAFDHSGVWALLAGWVEPDAVPLPLRLLTVQIGRTIFRIGCVFLVLGSRFEGF